MLLSSSNQTLMHSPGGVFLASSSPRSSGEVGTAIPAAGRLGLEQQAGDILLAPGAGAGVGIGPSFSPQDLLAPIGRWCRGALKSGSGSGILASS